MSKAQRKILTHLGASGSITWLEATELLNMDVVMFLEEVGELAYKGFISTSRIPIELKKGEPCMVNVYKLTTIGKRLLTIK